MSRSWKTFALFLILAAIEFWTLWNVYSLEDQFSSWQPLRVALQSEEVIPAEYLGTYTITAYCSCEKCCGVWALNRPNGIVYGAANEPLVEGISAAALPDTLPIGSKVYIEGIGVRVIQDTTASYLYERYDGKLIDVYCSSHEAAVDIAKQSRGVWLIDA